MVLNRNWLDDRYSYEGLCYPDEQLGWNHRITLTLGSLFSRLHRALHLESQKFTAGSDLTNENKILWKNPKSRIVSKDTKPSNCRGRAKSDLPSRSLSLCYII